MSAPRTKEVVTSVGVLGGGVGLGLVEEGSELSLPQAANDMANSANNE